MGICHASERAITGETRIFGSWMPSTLQPLGQHFSTFQNIRIFIQSRGTMRLVIPPDHYACP